VEELFFTARASTRARDIAQLSPRSASFTSRIAGPQVTPRVTDDA
jgi:hypothetical protein